MNASGRPNTCKSNGVAIHSGARVRNTYATYLILKDSLWKRRLILNGTFDWHQLYVKDLLV